MEVQLCHSAACLRAVHLCIFPGNEIYEVLPDLVLHKSVSPLFSTLSEQEETNLLCDLSHIATFNPRLAN